MERQYQILVKNTMKVSAFNENGHSYKIYYINGTFVIDTNINVGNATDDFNKVGLSREVVTINAGKTVSSTVGKGLAMGSMISLLPMEITVRLNI